MIIHILTESGRELGNKVIHRSHKWYFDHNDELTNADLIIVHISAAGIAAKIQYEFNGQTLDVKFVGNQIAEVEPFETIQFPPGHLTLVLTA